METNYVGQNRNESGVYVAIARGIGRPSLRESIVFRRVVDRCNGGVGMIIRGLKKLEHPLQGLDTIQLVQYRDGRIKPSVRWNIEPVGTDDPEIIDLLREGVN